MVGSHAHDPLIDAGHRPAPAGRELDRLSQHGGCRLGDRGPSQLRADPPRLGACGREPLRLLDVAADGVGERGGVGERHDLAGTRAEHVLRVPVRGRDDAAAGGKAEGERPRRDLLALPIRSHEDVGFGKEVGDLVDTEEPVVELDVVLETQVEDRLLECQTVALALAMGDVRVRSSGDHVEHLGVACDDRGQRLDRRLEPLPRGDQPERREHEPFVRPAGGFGRRLRLSQSALERDLAGAPRQHRRRTVGHDTDLALCARAPIDEEAPCGVGHHDDELGLTAHGRQHLRLMTGRLREHRVQCHHERL